MSDDTGRLIVGLPNGGETKRDSVRRFYISRPSNAWDVGSQKQQKNRRGNRNTLTKSFFEKVIHAKTSIKPFD